MVKKMHSSADSSTHSDTKTAAKGAAASLMDSQLAHSVKESAQQIWLAGMGAFSKAQEEGSKVFEALVKEGMHLQKKTQAVAEDKIGEVTGRMTAMADSVSAKAGQNWDKLEAIFEQRTAKALSKLGVPTAKDVDALAERVDALAATVARLGRSSASQHSAAPAKTATRPAAKTSAKSAARPAVKAAVKPAIKRARKAATF